MPRPRLSLAVGLILVAGMATPAWAQRGRHSGTVTTPYGTFSAQEMRMGGGNPEMAAQIRQQQQFNQYQQQMFKQQQAFQQQQAKQADFLKKHPEAARAMTPPAKATTTTKKATKKADKKKPADDTAATTAATKPAG